jgi:hypothetical protein
MTTQTLPFKNGDTVIFDASKWNENYKDDSQVYTVKVTDFAPEDETFCGVFLNGKEEGESCDRFYANYFKKIIVD